MYYQLFSFNQPYLNMPFPFIMVGIQPETESLILNYQGKSQLGEKPNNICIQQQKQQIYTCPRSENTKDPINRDKLQKKQEKSKLQKKQLPKKSRDSDSFTERRNIIPNNINHILAFIQRKSKSEHLVDRIIKKFSRGIEYTTKRYYCYQTFLKQKLNLRVNKELLHTLSNHLELTQDIFSVEEQLFYNRVCRVAINYYFHQLAKLKILSSSKVKCTNKRDHLRAHRTLLRYSVGSFDEV